MSPTGCTSLSALTDDAPRCSLAKHTYSRVKVHYCLAIRLRSYALNYEVRQFGRFIHPLPALIHYILLTARHISTNHSKSNLFRVLQKKMRKANVSLVNPFHQGNVYFYYLLEYYNHMFEFFLCT